MKISIWSFVGAAFWIAVLFYFTDDDGMAACELAHSFATCVKMIYN